jgi:exonuclease VII small subunit
MSITTDVRKYGETVVEQGKIALDEARKPWYAAVGASDLAYDRLQRQLTQLPTEVQARLRQLRANAGDLDAAHLRDAVGSAAGQAKEAYVAYTGQARERYESLAHRGELVVRRLRRRPEVHEAFDKAEDLISTAGRKVEEAEEKVTKPGRPKTAPRSTTGRKTPATKA